MVFEFENITVSFQQGTIIIQFNFLLYFMNETLDDCIKIMPVKSKFLQPTVFHFNQMIAEPICTNRFF